MLGKWDNWYKGLTKKDLGAFLYGDTETYKLAAEFLSDMKVVEDWGCGVGGFKRFYKGKLRYTAAGGNAALWRAVPRPTRARRLFPRGTYRNLAGRRYTGIPV